VEDVLDRPDMIVLIVVVIFIAIMVLDVATIDSLVVTEEAGLVISSTSSSPTSLPTLEARVKATDEAPAAEDDEDDDEDVPM
jgi:hypothetical protein